METYASNQEAVGANLLAGPVYFRPSISGSISFDCFGCRHLSRSLSSVCWTEESSKWHHELYVSVPWSMFLLKPSVMAGQRPRDFSFVHWLMRDRCCRSLLTLRNEFGWINRCSKHHRLDRPICGTYRRPRKMWSLVKFCRAKEAGEKPCVDTSHVIMPAFRMSLDTRMSDRQRIDLL